MDAFPDMEQHLHERASIVVDPTFESAIVKVLRNETRMLTPSEKFKLEPLKRLTTSTAEMPHEDINDNVDNLNFTQRLLKRRRISTDSLEYIDLSFIPPTSNIVERLFSAAKLNFTRSTCISSPNNL